MNKTILKAISILLLLSFASAVGYYLTGPKEIENEPVSALNLQKEEIKNVKSIELKKNKNIGALEKTTKNIKVNSFIQ